MTVLLFILILSLLVVIHELGHFFMARKQGVEVQEFGFGYPPLLKKLFTWRGTDFTLNAIPFGGFVRLKGEEFNPDDRDFEPINQQAFYAKSALARIAVIFAGPLANILYAVLAFCVVFGVMGVPHFLDGRPRIETVAVNSPAEKAGLQAQSEIIGFRLFDDLVLTENMEQVVEFVQQNQGQEVQIIFTDPCDGLVCPETQIEQPIYLRPEAETPTGEGSMGVMFADFFLESGPWYSQLINGAWYGIQQSVALGVLIVSAVIGLFRDLFMTGTVPAGLTGPVGIVDQASRSSILTSGWAPLVEFSGILSINLGIMNLLPIPALDGGRILFVLLEKIVGKKRIQHIEGKAHYVGFILLIGLIVLVSFRDIVQIFQS
ncbi:MAG: M50 family metallopeptidase [Candidatus Paceibacterota bacterium]